jgi:hypothetical protein
VIYRVEKPQSTGWQHRLHQLEAVERWYRHCWSKLDARLRSSITEGVVIFLTLFGHNPAVQAAFCPPRSAYTGMLKPDDPPSLPPIEELLETGHALALNFPVAMNPGLARALGVLLPTRGAAADSADGRAAGARVARSPVCLRRVLRVRHGR